MGREVKRVPLDFEWPIDKVWKGYLNPFYQYSKPCPFCEGSGSSPEAKVMSDQWYGNAPFNPEDRGSIPYLPDDPIIVAQATRKTVQEPAYYGRGDAAIKRECERLCGLFNKAWSHHLNEGDVDALIKAKRLTDFTHTWKKGNGWIKNVPESIPMAKQVNDWSLSGMGHDSINQWVVVSAECKKLGVSERCAHCKGEGTLWLSKEYRKKCDAWEREEPPQGDGWQVWETVSEGSPISPVFSTPEALAKHMTTTRWGGDQGTSYENWMKFIVGAGWCMSMVMDNGVLKDGVVFAAEQVK